MCEVRFIGLLSAMVSAMVSALYRCDVGAVMELCACLGREEAQQR